MPGWGAFRACLLLAAGETESWASCNLLVDLDITDASVRAEVVSAQDGTTIFGVLAPTAITFVGGVSQALSAMGAAPWTPAAANKHAVLRVRVSGGTPAVEAFDAFWACPVIDFPEVTSVLAPDTVDGVEGTGRGCAPPDPPVCFGVIDAAPYAQGCILVRFYEMCCAPGTIPWRYDFHVKRAVDGPLTPAEINAGTYYARSIKAFEVNGCTISSPGFGDAGVLMAAIAFESPGSISPPVVAGDENMHLFSNQQYYVAVRAMAIDANLVWAEDANTETVLSYSSGYQGVVWQHILSWPCIEFCDDFPVLSVNVNSLPGLSIEEVAGSIPVSVPPLDIQLRASDVVQDLARVLTEAIKEAVRGMKE